MAVRQPGTEATLDACRSARAHRRSKIPKTEGTYHGHHDSLMESVFPSEEDAGPRDRPVAVPQTKGLPKEFVDPRRDVLFNDPEAAKGVADTRASSRWSIVEPAMTNCGPPRRTPVTWRV